MQHVTFDGKRWSSAADGSPIESAPIQRNESVPLFVAAEAYKEYSAQYGTSQSLARLNERGGFGAAELCILLCERIERIEGAANAMVEKFTPTNSDYATALRVRCEFIRYIDENKLNVNYDDWLRERLNAEIPHSA